MGDAPGSPHILTAGADRTRRIRKLTAVVEDLLFFAFLVLPSWWVVLYSLNPHIVRVVMCPDDLFPRPCAPPDPVKCLMYAVLLAVVTGALFMLSKCLL